ncbi:MAG: fructose-1,6-bisphosphatase [Gammaproteobacteria bacterium]|nr:fructose-1,6-bisphosphatase [Gammaproteobacteria bacterium]MCP5425624.1 fructose-1,6-bisphosphatase [Gammaproteobacteria bacterium]MCP5458978.1 fructose-1,6-bisphosphatase [Gammaproteobacteria bacterium]
MPKQDYPQDPHMRYLELLADEYPSLQAASAKIVELTAQLDLAKGTEHFLSDIHGEYEAFRHALKTGSGSIRRKIEQIFSDQLTEQDKRNLALLIYYPEEKLPLIPEACAGDASWYRTTLAQLVSVATVVAAKYPLARVRSVLPPRFAPIIEELLQKPEAGADKAEYYSRLVETVIETGMVDDLVVALAELIQRLVIARLHIIGDIYDRGPGAHLIMDTLIDYHTVDIQWGNHDIVWMGAAAGSEACIANVIRICLRYANMDTLENGYAISLLPLASLAMEFYGDDPCEHFLPRSSGEQELTDHERQLMARMHKAITLIQLKLEGQVIQRRPQYQMDDRLLLDKIDYAQGTIRLDGKVYPLLDLRFPTVDPQRPYDLSEREQAVIDKLRLSFVNSARLQKHVRFLFSNGSMYLAHNGNLLYHGCIALNEDGSFKAFKVDGEEYAGKAFVDRVDRLARQGYFATDDPPRKQYGMDAMWYMWSGEQSPLFGKAKMATFERYFLADKETHKEKRNPYYDLRNDEATARKILREFGVNDETGHIVNGHVPVRTGKGESPVKAGGKLIVIDGGLSKAYQKTTGIGGFTLVSNSHGLVLVAHEPFESAQDAIERELDAAPRAEVLEECPTRKHVRDTNLGQTIQRQIDELKELLHAFKKGLVKER